MKEPRYIPEAEVSRRIKALLAGRGQQAEVARKTQLTEATISRVAAGTRKPPADLLALIGVRFEAGYVEAGDA